MEWPRRSRIYTASQSCIVKDPSLKILDASQVRAIDENKEGDTNEIGLIH